jgi:NADPH-dependent 2,4-dienoyl-CoA reductase/sulfur reductase-like enzyme/ferredoxin
MAEEPKAAALPFPNYTQLDPLLPVWAWDALRVLSILAALGLAALLWFYPPFGLKVFWGVAVPVLPLVFFVAPGLWRNLCPLAAANQMPRLGGFTAGIAHTDRMKELAYPVGIALFFALVVGRKFLFNASGEATAILVVGALAGAFAGGLIFKGKSGWCSSICPMLPVQRLYGQTPFVTVANTHCRPCVGCAKNCYDFNPRIAWLADQYDNVRHYAGYRRFFAGVLPGFVLAFYLVPAGDAAVMGLLTLGYMGLSLALYHAVDVLLKARQNEVPVLFAAAALNIYYWFAAPTLMDSLAWLGAAPPVGSAYALQAAVLALSLLWVARSWRVELRFLDEILGESAGPARVSAAGGAALRAASAGTTELKIDPEGKRIAVKPGQSVLEAVEGCGLHIESGCRMGVCGADPVAITAGAGELSPPSADERSTLERLGHAANTRMACCARIQGPVTVELKPHRRSGPAAPATKLYNRNIKRVVVAGAGIAGLTAADHLRRNHPDCEIHVVGREKHFLYNRMGISRLIYGRSAMQGLYLMPESWYAERRIEMWLNTRLSAIDTAARGVRLATGEALEYDRLILATGAQCTVPAIEGFGARGSFVLREADGAMAIRDYIQHRQGQHAVVAGAGLLGLEAAYALHKAGLRTVVVANGDWILNRQLDERAGSLLRKYFESIGIEVLTRTEVRQVRADWDGEIGQVKLKDGRILPADVFLVCAGVKPDTALAAAAGIAVQRGIVVNERMETSVPGVYAAGDCAEYQGETSGLWPVAVEQGEVAAVNALGARRPFRGSAPATILKVQGADLVSIGRIAAQGAGEREVIQESRDDFKYRKLVLVNGRLAGAILMGYPLEVPLVTRLVRENADLLRILTRLDRGDWESLKTMQAPAAAAAAH